MYITYGMGVVVPPSPPLLTTKAMGHDQPSLIVEIKMKGKME
jgi:hypothetical protein